MPQRTRKQILEEESRRAFADALGSSFLFRDELPDFSIDGGVEAFDDDGQPTGLRYLAQLKATDGANNSRNMAVQLEVDKAAYYYALPLPVLMVRYFARDGGVYARWFHSLRSQRTADKPKPKTMTFRWQPEDGMSEETPARLAAEASSFLALRSARPPFPFPFALRADHAILGISPRQLSVTLRQELVGRRDIVDFRPEVPDGSGYFTVDGLELSVELPGAKLASYDLTDSYDPGPAGEQIAIDLLVLAAVAFSRWGQADAAGRLTSSYFARSTLAGRMEASLPLASEMARARMVREALQLADELDELDEPKVGDAAFVFTLPALHNSESLSSDELALHRRVLQSRINRREARGADAAAAREWVNLGNHYRGQNEPGEAVTCYERGGELDPEYRGRVHYWQEFAGVLFLTGCYDRATEAYDQALKLGAEPFTKLLYADSLLYAGRYREAEETFAEAQENRHSFERSAEYTLKRFVIRDLIEKVGIEEQKRDPAAAARLIETVEMAGDAEEAAQLMVEALRQDGLAGTAWFNLAHAHREQGKEDVASSLFISAAVCMEGDVEAWSLATFLTFNVGDMMLVPLIFVTGQRMTAGALLPGLSAVVAREQDPEGLDAFLTAFEQLITDFSDGPGGGYAVRGLKPDGKVEVTEFEGATTPRPRAD